MKIILLFPILLFVFFTHTVAGIVDTVTINSTSMGKQIKCVVIRPTNYKQKNKAFPVVYLLHGFSGDYSNWITRVPELSSYTDLYQLIIVCPDGDYASWYFDSPVNLRMKYETYIGTEVPKYIDSAYKTLKNRNQRAITGLSMGGHGALFIAWRHADAFGACGSISGVMDLKESAHKFYIEKVLGDPLNHSDTWKNYSVLNLIEKKPLKPLEVTFDCGVDDIFITGNRKVHQKMLLLNIAHDYTERPGIHSWQYWKNSIQFHLLFFSKFFKSHVV